MGRASRKLNNQGSTLITVIICMALFGILGSLMLSVTMTNLQMKLVESKAKKNFYTCEEAMEEIRTGIQEITAAKIRLVYENIILTNYADYLAHPEDPEAPDHRNAFIKKEVAEEIIKELGNTSAYPEDMLTTGIRIPAKGNDIFNTYLSAITNPELVRTVTIGDPDRYSDTIYSDGKSVVIEDIRVVMEIDEYKTSITSDIVITLPEFTFDEGTEIIRYKMDPLYQDYALVADGGIISDQDAPLGNLVNGNVYAGEGGIRVGGKLLQLHELTIKGEQVVTRGDITVEDTGKLTITKMEGSIIPPIIWADNLVTNTTESYPGGFTKPTTLDINGICFVKDDLNLEGRYSDVTIRGAYVGYSGIHTEEGSAIIINGTGSTLDLYELDSMILAGRAHVSVDDPDLASDADIMTGESLAFKSNQRAYLIPGRFIEDMKHNPITQGDITALGHYPGVLFDTYDPLDPKDIDYEQYIAALPIKPYKIAAKQTVEGNTSTLLNYYYMNFGSGKQADAYFQDYSSKFMDEVLNKMAPFILGEVILPENTGTHEIISAGYLMSYDLTEVHLTSGLSNSYPTDPAAIDPDQELDSMIYGTLLDHPVYQQAYSTGGLQPSTQVGSLGALYSKMTHLLSLEDTSSYRETDEVVKASVHSDGIHYINTLYEDSGEYRSYTGDQSFDSSNPLGGTLILVDGNVNLNCDFNGLLAATGDITIGDGVTINGMVISTGIQDEADPSIIISGGNIVAGASVTVNGRLVAIRNIILGTGDIINAAVLPDLRSIFENYGDILLHLFRNAKLSINFTMEEPASNLVDLSSMISYDNWRKN